MNSVSTIAVAALCLASGVQLCPSNAFPSPMSTRTRRAAVIRQSHELQHFHRKFSPSETILFQSHSLPRLWSSKRYQLQLSMDSSENNSDSESNFENKNNPRSQSEKNDTDEDIWEPMDYDEADEFFASITETDGDDYVDSENADELFRVLQDMIDNNSVTLIDDQDFEEIDEETLLEILGLDDDDDDSMSQSRSEEITSNIQQTSTKTNDRGMRDLERALMEGVVPADAGVGSGILPGDIGFDPLELSTKDYFKQVQTFILNLVPERKNQIRDEAESENNAAGAALPTLGFVGEEGRPPALILRDYREAEIRHSRLAMLAAVIWPLQEILDRLFIPESFGSMTVVYGGTTLPFLPLLMTFLMLNLGYLDIYSSEIKENESGDAFLPGECFWDPLCIMEGAPDRMKRNMQEREILNGRAAMIAVAAFTFEEGMTHKPIITLEGNELLFEPAYQIPIIQAWLDQQFGSIGDAILIP
ncbi:hypothetical protein HJC23_005937 [Cyclotella cryptica]|uniref:Uncharacterized protein n=1 Tax=Cyclotella cryptica TaxID=29204 RepID=A0ABD3QZN7_9STRA